MKPRPAILALLALLPSLAWGQDISLNTLVNDYRNTFSMAGPPVGPAAPVPTANQWSSGSPLGGWQTTSIREKGIVVAGSATPDQTGPTTLIKPSFTVTDPDTHLPAAGTVTLASAVIGRPLVSFKIGYLLGEAIPPPAELSNGSPAPADFYKPEPRLHVDPVTKISTDLFYYSIHAQKVFATVPGTVEVTWVPKDGSAEYKKTYTIGEWPVTTPRTIYWTQQPFTGPPVKGPNRSVNIVYTPNFPKEVLEKDRYVSLTETSQPPQVIHNSDGTTTTIGGAAPELRTFWYDESKHFRAYNITGTAFVEYLGDSSKPSDPAAKEQKFLGFEIVNIERETSPTPLKTFLGEQVLPPPPGTPDTLTANVVNGLDGTTDPFIYEQSLRSGALRLYAIRPTTSPDAKEVLVYWMQSGVLDVLWPETCAQYVFSWPSYAGADADANYSIYARPSSGAGDPKDTAVTLNLLDNPFIAFQSGPTTFENGKFYTSVVTQNGSYNPADNLTLIRYTNGEEIYFERVLSRPQDKFPGASTSLPINVGTRIEPPVSPKLEPLVGYINQKTGTAFNPDAYKDPFVVGFDEAKKGAIIPVNALDEKNKLEVWWFKKNSPPTGSAIKSTLWPQAVQSFTIQWPADAPSIVLASNAGSGDLLTPEQQTGKIYTQNDEAKPGYNPNEEHALMLHGKAWALRDDLTSRDVQKKATSSEPYVLVDYTAADARPAMRVFKVEREIQREINAIIFSYDADAGKTLQAPMPLPLLPVAKDSAGLPKNKEVDNVPDKVPGPDPTGEFAFYNQFTFADRKGVHYVYRGPHAGGGSRSFDMQYWYPMQDGFAFPTKAKVDYPKLGDPVPYLRAKNAVGGDFIGDAVTGDPLKITFKPKWPEGVPSLRVGETLTLPKHNLPAVRTQRSVQVLYQQSIAKDIAKKPKSAILHDPTREKVLFLFDGLPELPESIKKSTLRGLTYFPNLPPHLSGRFFFDPKRGKLGALVLAGKYVAETTGESYLLPNVINDDVTSKEDLIALKNLVTDKDKRKSNWDIQVEFLSTDLKTLVKSTTVNGEFSVGKTKTIWSAGISEITSDNIPVDSYALTAGGNGTGYVVLINGNGINTNIVPPDEPVTMEVIRVELPLYRGEAKVLASDNPLDEKLTIQHTGDFAGKAQDYDFEWKYKAPLADGTPPTIYSVAQELLVDHGEWSVLEIPAGHDTRYRTQAADPETIKLPVNLPGALDILNTDKATNPRTVLRRNFKVPGTRLPGSLYLSWDLEETEGAAVYLNGALLAARGVPGLDPTPVSTDPGSPLSPLSTVFEIPSASLKLNDPLKPDDTPNILTVELYSKRNIPSKANLKVRLEGTALTDESGTWAKVDPAAVPGKNRLVTGDSGILALGDNFYSVRYKPNKPEMAGYDADPDRGWSDWVNPVLAEGWIKRALAGINPFNQRVTDLYNSAVNPQVSMITQAGTQYEGDVALNSENMNSTGLIEIYQTILLRGRALSIDGTNPVNDSGANNAITLAAGYITDLYTILGNEAYADAQNPTIAIGTTWQSANTTIPIYANINTSRFTFEGEVSSLIDEELALLRGRDDSIAPTTTTRPFYNRLFWNYTRGINSGEQFYASNYDMKDVNTDGKVDVNDAAATYPQGHGDAYGHYLSALKSFYSLLRNPKFTWVPHTEPLNVANTTVQVGYQNERRFAGAAAGLTRTLQQIVDLTYRKDYTPSSTGKKWAEFRDEKKNSSTNLTRYWGLDEWASRGGQGAFFHWVTVNSLLPATDDAHQGITKIDRTTVPELDEIALSAQAIQNSLQNADARLNPLGLTSGAMVFDISPAEVDAGRTHYEQIYSRAIAALSNANLAYSKAQDSSNLLRVQADSTAAQKIAIDDQEWAYKNQLIEIYGTPYSDDIGPGKSYDQGYDGPDTLGVGHYLYIDMPEELAVSDAKSQQTITVKLKDKYTPNITHTDVNNLLEGSSDFDFTISAAGAWQKPEKWTGKRATPGKIQAAVSELYLARKTLLMAAKAASHIKEKLEMETRLYNEKVKYNELQNNSSLGYLSSSSEFYMTSIYKDWVASQEELAQGAAAGARAVVEAAVPNGSFDWSFWLRAATKGVGVGWQKVKAAAISLAKNSAAQAKEFDTIAKNTYTSMSGNYKTDHDNQQLLYGLGTSMGTVLTSSTKDFETAVRRYEEAQMNLDTLLASGGRIQLERETFRRRAAAVIQGYRTNDYLFRTFRSEALERYKALFDLSARYTFLAAKAYDYETCLLDAGTSTQAATFFQKIVKSRSPGVIGTDSQPEFGGSDSGDPGLAGVLAEMNADWGVAKTRLGFNNPDKYETTFSLRRENFRILGDKVGDAKWKDLLRSSYVPNIMDDPDVRRHALQLGVNANTPVPGFVIDFRTEIRTGKNFFGQPLAGGDSTFGPDSFATKIRSSGVAFEGYPGLDSPASTNGALGNLGTSSPSDPPISVTNSSALSATPYIYLLPAGADVMQTPPIGGVSTTRSWSVEDHAIPMPFNIGGTPFASNSSYVSANSLPESQLILRKHQSFRAVPAGTVFSSSPGFTNSRLIGRSVSNTRWKIVVPANTLLNDTKQGSEIFIQSVKDIKLHFKTYSYSGN